MQVNPSAASALGSEQQKKKKDEGQRGPLAHQAGQAKAAGELGRTHLRTAPQVRPELATYMSGLGQGSRQQDGYAQHNGQPATLPPAKSTHFCG
jgi:hypothetical protein